MELNLFSYISSQDSKIILYPKNEGEKSLPLTTAVEQFGRFDDIEDGDLGSNPDSKIEFKSVLITGKCCWEAFSRLVAGLCLPDILRKTVDG